MAVVQDITRDTQGKLRLSAAELKRLYELNITISDTETTGLQAGTCGLTEFASIRSVPDKGQKPPYRLELLHHYVLPLKPEFQDYLEACAEAEAEGSPAPPYDRERYEYQIHPQALAVTGTEFIRAHPDGPITAMKVNGQQVEGKPFYEVWHDVTAATDISRFTRDGVGDVYYNTPFDKPFLSALIRDVQAYQLASSNAHTHDEAEEGEPDPVYDYVCEHQPYLADLRYEEANDIERQHLLRTIREAVSAGEAYDNSALYQCLFYGFMKAKGVEGSRRLDDAYRQLVNPQFKERGNHSAVEDICMAAQVACALADPFQGRIPSMLDLFTQLVHQVDPKASVALAPTRHMPQSGGKTTPISGDIAIRFSQSPKKLGAKAQRLWDFLQAFEEAAARNDRVPEHILSSDIKTHAIVISAAHQKPLSLNLLRKWMLFDQLSASPLFEGFTPFDSTGTVVDVTLKGRYAKSKKTTIIEDVPLGALRANLTWFEAHPELAESTLELIRAIKRSDSHIGTVLIRGDQAKGFKLILSGHQRGMGSVVLPLPKGTRPADHSETILKTLPELITLGIIPYTDSLSQNSDEEPTPSDTASAPTSVMEAECSLSGKQLTLNADRLLLQLMAHELPKGTIDLAATHQTLPLRSGQTLAIDQQPDGGYRITGSLDAFHDFVLPRTSDTPATEGMSEKPSSILRNAGWLMQRLGQLPGTHHLSMDENGIVSLHQPDGVSLEALNLLYRARLPFKASAFAIKIDASQAMRDAFYWSQTLKRLGQDRDADQAKPLEEQRLLPKPFLRTIQHGLFSQNITAIRMDDLQQCWVVDAGASAETARYHKVDPNDTQHPYHRSGDQLDVISSPIQGAQRITWQQDEQGALTALTSAVVYAVWNQWRMRQGKPSLGINLKNTHQVEIPIAADQQEHAIAELTRVAQVIYQLYGTTAIERLPLSSIQQADETFLDLALPDIELLESQMGLLPDLIRLYGDVSQSHTADLIHTLQRQWPSPVQENRRHSTLGLLCDRITRKPDPGHPQDGIAMLRELGDRMGYVLSRLGSAEFADHPEALHYSKRIEHDLGSLGFLIHDITHQLEATPKQSPAYASLHTSLEAVRTAYDKLFCFHSANQRLAEASAVLRKALEGEGSQRGNPLTKTVAEAKTFLLCEEAMRLPASVFASVESLHEALANQRKILAALYQCDPADPTALATHPRYLSILRQAAFTRLAALTESGQNTPKHRTLIHYLLHQTHPTWSGEQIHAMITLYTRGMDEASLAKARNVLAAHFPEIAKRGQISVDMLIEQRCLAANPDHTPQPKPPSAEERQQIEETIRQAYEKRGTYYLKLISTSASVAEAHQSLALRERYEEQARHCLHKAGKTPAEISSLIEKHLTTHIKNKVYLKALREIERAAPEQIKGADDHLAVIEQPGQEAMARQAIDDKRRTTAIRQQKRLMQDLGDPYASLKHTRSLLASLERALEEMHDLNMVSFHALRDLAAAITLLYQVPQLRATVPSQLTQALTPILHSVQLTPEGYGLNQQTMQQVLHAQQQVMDRATSQVNQTLSAMQLPVTTTTHGHLRIPIEALVTWIDRHPDCALPALAPPAPISSAPISSASELPLPAAPVPPVASPAVDTSAITPSSLTGESGRRLSANHYRAVHHSVAQLMQLPRADLQITTTHSHQPEANRATLTLSERTDRTPDRIAQIVRDFAQSHLGAGSQLNEQAGTLSLNLPADRLPYLSHLLHIATKLEAIPAITTVTLIPSGLGLDIAITVPSGQLRRDQLQGQLQEATLALPARRTTALDRITSGKAGTTQSFEIVLDERALQDPTRIHEPSLREAVHIGAKMIGVPAAERESFITRVMKKPRGNPLVDLAKKDPATASHIDSLWRSKGSAAKRDR